MTLTPDRFNLAGKAIKKESRDHHLIGIAGLSESLRTRMIGNSESHKEADAVMMRALNTKTKTRIGFWNVRTMFSTSKLAQVTREMRENKLKGKRGGPKITRRRTVESEMKLLNLNWGGKPQSSQKTATDGGNLFLPMRH